MVNTVGRTLARLGISLAIVGLSSLVPTFVARRDYAIAWNNFAKNPTLENGVVLARVHVENRRIIFLTRVAVFVIVIVGWAVVSE